MYQANSVCICTTNERTGWPLVRHFVDGARSVKVATGFTRGVCTQCGHYVHADRTHPWLVEKANA